MRYLEQRCVSVSAGTQPSALVMLTESEVFGIYRYQLVDGTYERVPITTTTTEHHYVTQNGKVVRETIGTGETAQVLDFTYDADGRPFALTYTNGTDDPVTYYYVLNLQGDVVKLVEHARKGRVYYLNTVAEYTYDAWGKPMSTTDGEGNSVANTHIAKLNPLRYRGYYFDMETGFYYLQSRYYDPTLRRFINADSLASTGQGILGTNMFAYCNNNPVLYCDTSGCLRNYCVAYSDKGNRIHVDEMSRDFMAANAAKIQKKLDELGIVGATCTDVFYAGTFVVSDASREAAERRAKIYTAIFSLISLVYFVPTLIIQAGIMGFSGLLLDSMDVADFGGNLISDKRMLPNGDYKEYHVFVDVPSVAYGEKRISTYVLTYYVVKYEGVDEYVTCYAGCS